MSEKRRGLGRGLGALIPSAPPTGTSRPTDVFFKDNRTVSGPGQPGQSSDQQSGNGPASGGSGDDAPAAAEEARFTGNIAQDSPSVVAARQGHTDSEDAASPAGGGTRSEGFTGNHDSGGSAREGSSEGEGSDSGRAEAADVAKQPAELQRVDAEEPVPVTGEQGKPASAGAVPPDDLADVADDEARRALDEDGDDAEPVEGLAPVPGATFAEVPVVSIRPNPRQPRQVFDDDELAELVHSIREIGVLQPIVVRSVTPEDEDAQASERVAGEGRDADTVPGGGVRFELIMGERRWRAAQQAGLEAVPAIIKDTSDDDLLRDALLENLHRSQLNPLEEAAAYQQLLDDFGCTHEELAGRIGRSRPQISNTLRLLRLPPLVARRVAAGVLSAGHARALLALPDSAAMERMAQRIVAEGLSVRSVEEIVAVGGQEAPKSRSSAPRPGDRHPQLDDLAARLSDRFDTRVNISLGKRKGKLTVEFASVDDLNRILDILAPNDDVPA